MATYVDDFVDGLAPYTGTLTRFGVGTGPYGASIGGLAYTGASTSMGRTIPSTVFAKWSVWVNMTAEAPDDAASIQIRTGATYRAAIIPRREAAFDGARRPWVFIFGGAEIRQPISTALALNQWHRFEFIVASGAGNSSCAIYNAAGTLLGQSAFSGSYSPTSVDNLFLTSDSAAGLVPTQFAQLRVYEDLLPNTRIVSFDLQGKRIATRRTSATSLYTDLTTDKLHSVDGTSIVPLFQAAPQTGIWRSKVFITDNFPTFAWGRIEGEYPAVMRVYGDGVLRYTTPSITSRTPFRLPPGRYREWQVEVESSSVVTEVRLAGTAAELKD